ncbi:MAG: FMN-binding protein [Gammaproteobacteria bacterium]|nr:MAG: FMN-binding protein [Gammaproteobacteria bacterium]
MNRILQLVLVVLLLAALPAAASVYQTREDFLAEVFDGKPPPARSLWLRGALKQEVTSVLGHPYGRLRVRYWERDGRRAWVLEEIGKERPITFGVVTRDGRIENIRVLAFRESRGWEIRHPFFTRQFFGARLDEKQRLDRQIDGISGATLSVRAMKKVARLALLLDHHVASSAP